MRAPVLIVAILFPWLVLTAGTSGSGVVFNGVSSIGWIGDQCEVFHDNTNALDIDGAIGVPGFARVGSPVLNLGVSPAAHWVRFELRNTAHEGRPWILVQYPEIEELDVFLLQNGLITMIASVGQLRPLDALVQTSPLYGFAIPLDREEAGMVYLRARSSKQLQLPITICSAKEFHEYGTTRIFWIGGFIGIMLVMALYNLFVFISVRDRSYFLYVLFIAFVCLTQTSLLGFLGYHLLDLGAGLAANASLILTCLTAITAGAFMEYFLEASRYLKSYRKITMAFNVLLLLGVALALAGFPALGYQMGQAIAGIYALYQVYGAIRIRRQGSRPAQFFLLAWSLFLFGVVMFVLKDKNVIPYNAFSTYTMPIGSVAEVVLLSFGLADRINILRREKELSQAEALRISLENEQIIREQNVLLERKVGERTLELRQSNEHLKQTQSQLVNAEKMASIGQLTAGIAHEISNPVNFITSNIAPLRRDLEDMLEVLGKYRATSGNDPRLMEIVKLEQDLGLDDSIAEIKDLLGSIEEGAGRTAEIVRGLRNFSRLDEDGLKPADINEGLRSTITVLAPQIRDQLTIEIDLAELPEVECHPGKLNQVFMNMLTNAAQSVRKRHPGGEGCVNVITRQENGAAVVVIRDNGMGMPPEVRSRIFEPFFTTKDVGEGTGLGLSIAYGIIEKHHGRIEVDSVEGQGAEFRIILPMQQPNTREQRA